MTVRELIEQLRSYPQDSLVLVEDEQSLFGGHEVYEMYQSEVTYGILTNNPTTYKTVVLV